MSTLTFAQALEQSELLARQRLDASQTHRISCAAALVRSGKVLQLDDGTWQVQSEHAADKSYHVNGQCPCEDSHFNHPPQDLCKHRIAVYLSRKVVKLMQESAPVVPAPQDVPVPDPVPEPVPVHPAIPAHLIQDIQGQSFVKYAGLLQLAHDAGLQSLAATWTHNDNELSLAHAVATFQDGRRFEECGDSTPQNARRVKDHWRRLSLTRAKARALRDALGLDLASVEEMD